MQHITWSPAGLQLLLLVKQVAARPTNQQATYEQFMQFLYSQACKLLKLLRMQHVEG